MKAPRAILFLFAFTLLACSPADPEQLLAENPWLVARESGRFVFVHGLRMFAITEGEGPDVVLVHGMIDSTFTWRHVFPTLAKEFRVHAIDLPGFGFSDKPDADYETAWLADFVAGYLDVAGVSNAMLVGNSMGGNVAIEVAIRHPDRVSSLILLEASGAWIPRDDEMEEVASEPPSWVTGLLRSDFGEALVRMLPTRGVLRDSLTPAYFSPEELTDERLDAWHGPLQTENGMAAFMARSTAFAVAERDEEIRTIRAPTLVITGDTDRMVEAAVAERYAELIPGSEFELWEDTGHMIQEQRPDRVIASVRRWALRP